MSAGDVMLLGPTVAGVVALAVLAARRLISPARFAQAAAGLSVGALVAKAVVSIAGAAHG